MKMKKSRVVCIKGKVLQDEQVDTSPDVLKRMIETGLHLLTGFPTPAQAWSRYFSPRDIIGIKVNCLGGRHMCSHPSLAQATAISLKSLGIAPHQVIIWERTSRELMGCGFPLNRRKNSAFRCFGTDERGVGYEKDLTVHGSIASRFSTIQTRLCTTMINMPVVKDHGLTGLTVSLKNIFGTLHNPNKYHENRCDPYIADANTVPFVREKHRLVICDALHVQYKGGPSFHPQWARAQGNILMAEDMVALDSVCADMLNRIRAKQGFPPVEEHDRLPVHLRTAANSEHRLGVCHPEQIELIEASI